ncbi:autophagy-related protein 101 isoform X1 [Arctopsyche grandis]|uniref:autophagy-related protein 101 isoform X1 n=1 Tax=Arctopsyche grandis TaxID=121162 RepID=UPI00406D8324
MGSATSTCTSASRRVEETRSTRSTLSTLSLSDPPPARSPPSHSHSHSQPQTRQISFSSFGGNLSGRSFATVASNYSGNSSTRPWSRISRRRWNNSTLSSPLLASKTAWPVPYVESLFLPEFKINSDFQTKKYELLNTISQGAFGKVYKVKDIETDELSALKVLSKSQIISDGAIKQVKDEVHIQEVCGHNPFIVSSSVKWQSRKRLFIVTEYIPGGELLSRLETYKKLPEQLVKIYVAEIALVLDFLHNAGVIYRDLKPENLLLNALGHIQLIDFGLSKWLKYGSRTTTLCGTLHYMAPEIANREPYGHAVDWWSLGVIACRMLTDCYPNSEGDVLEGLELSSAAKRLLLRLLDPVPICRLRTLKTLQETAFFKDFNFAEVRAMTICPNDVLKSHFPNGPPDPPKNSTFSDFNDSKVEL